MFFLQDLFCSPFGKYKNILYTFIFFVYFKISLVRQNTIAANLIP